MVISGHIYYTNLSIGQAEGKLVEAGVAYYVKHMVVFLFCHDRKLLSRKDGSSP